VAHLHHTIPHVFNTPAADGSLFRCSATWVKRFIYENLKWSFHRATQAAQKTPTNADKLCREQFLRHAVTACDTAMPSPGFRVNIDQTNIVYQPSTSSTYNNIGTHQVSVVGKEEKRAFTVVVGISDNGDVLPFQAIFASKSSRSCPNEQSPLFCEAMELGFKLKHSKTDTYWSTLELMCKYVDEIVAPYFLQQKELAGVPKDQDCILQLDVWSVHRSVAFRTWLDKNYPWIVYLFILGGCTGIAQPCDIGIQRPLKLAINHAQHTDIVDETLASLQAGSDPSTLRLNTKVTALRDCSVAWLVKGYHAINKPSLVKKVCSLHFYFFYLFTSNADEPTPALAPEYV